MRSAIPQQACYNRWPEHGQGRNRCLISPPNVLLTAEALERRGNCWFVHTNFTTDLTVQVGEDSFFLHKLPIISKIGYLNQLFFEGRRTSNGETDNQIIELNDLPGGVQAFELVVKFCYGLAIELTTINITPLYCAAQFLEMFEDVGEGNLVSKTEYFLSYVIFSSWKDTFVVLKSCEVVAWWASELQVSKRCCESIAWKACMSTKSITQGHLTREKGAKNKEVNSNDSNNNNINSSGNNNEDSSTYMVLETWWFEDVSLLSIDHFVKVITAIKAKGMKSELVGSCIMHWASKWFTWIEHTVFRNINDVKESTMEGLIMALPIEGSTIPFNFLLRLLKIGLLLNISTEVVANLERRAVMMLEGCSIGDFMVKNYGDEGPVYDVSLVTRLIESYVVCASTDSAPKMGVVARILDEYLAVVGRDENLSVESFQLLAEALPENARHCNDYLYRAVDTYLKSHPSLVEEERRRVCRAMEYKKLSLEARTHALQNERLPLRFTVRFVLLEQVNMAKSILASGNDYRRRKTHAITRVRKGLEERWVKSHKKLQSMKAEVETMKVLLNELQVGHAEILRRI